jgi:hydroxymethylglutaryl-CoA reductase
MTSEAMSAARPSSSTSSELPGFYRLSVSERVARLIERLGLEGVRDLGAGLDVERADRMVENAIGVLGLPLGVCANLRVDGRDYIVPMAIEEPSVIAAASAAAKLLRSGAGLITEVAPPLMEGQIQLLDVADPERARSAIDSARARLLEHANDRHPRLVAAGGGARDISGRVLEPRGEGDPLPAMFIVDLLVDVGDAMGANLVNSMCEELAPEVERLVGGRARLRILTNLCRHRTVTVRGSVPLASFDDDDVARGIVEASVFAERDVHRATTHNKGIMNGIDAVLVAFGQDWRAVEAAAHAWAARSGRYSPLAQWRIEGDRLTGEMTLPLAVGVVGGITRVHPTVRSAFRIAGLTRASTLASVAAAVGLAQNLGALRALAAEGIQHGHMRLHARKRLVTDGADQRANRDRSYCEAVLPRVSRTFALSIEELPEKLRESVCTAYLLCRIVDTVEDEPGLDTKLRSSLFDGFDALVVRDDVSPSAFEREWSRLFAGREPSAEVDLAQNAGAVFRSFRRLPERAKSAIRPHVLEMSGALVAAAGTAIVGAAGTVAVGLAGLALAAAGTAVLFPTLLGVLTAVVPQDARGAATSVLTVVAYLGFTAGPVYVGLWADAVGLPGAMTALALLAAALAVVAPPTVARTCRVRTLSSPLRPL